MSTNTVESLKVGRDFGIPESSNVTLILMLFTAEPEGK